MVKRTKRMGFIRPADELKKLGPARDMLIDVRTKYPINSDAYRRAGEAIKAIDDLAEELVGDRQLFWAEKVPIP